MTKKTEQEIISMLIEALYLPTEFTVEIAKWGYNKAVDDHNKGFPPEKVHDILLSRVDKKGFKGRGKKKSRKRLKKLNQKLVETINKVNGIEMNMAELLANMNTNVLPQLANCVGIVAINSLDKETIKSKIEHHQKEN